MNKLRLMMSFMRGNRAVYAGALISVALASLFSICIPVVIRIVIDSIIGTTPLPSWFRLDYMGSMGSFVERIWAWGIVLVALTLIQGLFAYLGGKWSAVASESVAKNMREKLFEHLQNLSFDYHVNAKTGDLIQRCTSDLETVRQFLSFHIIEIGRSFFILVLVLISMISLDVRMTIVSTAIIPFILLSSIFFFAKIRSIFKEADETEGRLSTVLQENLTGVRVVRAFARQDYETDKFKNVNTEFRDLILKLIKLMAFFWSGSDFLCMLQAGLVLILGAYWASMGILSLGTFIAFISYIGMLLWPIRQLGSVLTEMGKSVVSLQRIKEILDTPGEKEEMNSLRPEIRGDIVFDKVSFAYDNMPVLKDISFSVQQGQTVAILGPTGSGKSSLIHLLSRLYDYQNGSIRINGIELKNIDKKWIRQNIGMVLQEPFLYSKTIKDNIILSKPGLNEYHVFEAARAASIHDAIVSFEKGYDTKVGERGVTLSGGQKQRIAISRALIRNCPILILDDSLSAVDTETENAIRDALNNKYRGITTFIISHRISTLSQADFIIVLEHGSITQIGTHEELIKQADGLYKKIWALQSFAGANMKLEVE